MSGVVDVSGTGRLPLVTDAVKSQVLPITTWTLLLALIVVNVILQPGILTVSQIGLTVQTALPLVFVCMGQSAVLLTGGIDLSVGGVFAVATVLSATWTAHGAGWRLPLIVGIGALLGGVNGLLTTRLRINSFIATLATWSIFDGVALHILSTAGGSAPLDFTTWITGSSAGLPNAVIVLIAAILAWSYFSRTTAGRHLYAVGSDESRARLSRVNVTRTQLMAYVLSGAAAAIGGICLALVTATGDPTAGDGYILLSIEGAVIGGVSLAGGRGGAGMAVVGAFILIEITNVTDAVNLAPWVATVASAGLLLVVVGIRSRFERRAAP